VFNPATLQGGTTNAIMDVANDHAQAGFYPLAVAATVNDPTSGMVCSSSSTVTLVVGENLADFALVAHQGQVTVDQAPPIPSATQGIQVKPGDGTAAIRVTLTQASGGAPGPS